MLFSYTHFQKNSLLWEHPPPARSLRSLALASPLTNSGCTTGTDIAKGTRGHAPPPPRIDWNKIHFRKGGIGDCYTCHFTYPLIMAFNVQENAVFIHKFSKNLPTVRGGDTPSPRLKILATPVSLCMNNGKLGQ